MNEERWDENLDSDDDQFKSTGPVPRRPRAENSEPEAKAEADLDEDQEMGHASMEPPASDPISDVLEDDGLDDDASPLSAVAEKLYTPEQILDRDFKLLYKKKKGRYGAMTKKLIGWRQRILVGRITQSPNRPGRQILNFMRSGTQRSWRLANKQKFPRVC